MFPSINPPVNNECVGGGLRTVNNVPIRDSSNRYSSFFSCFLPFTRFWGVFTAIVLCGVGVDLAFHRHNSGYYLIGSSAAVLFLEVTWVVTLFLQLCVRSPGISTQWRKMHKGSRGVIVKVVRSQHPDWETMEPFFRRLVQPKKLLFAIKMFLISLHFRWSIYRDRVEQRDQILLRRNESRVFRCWSIFSWLEGWKKSLLYGPLGAVPLICPHKLWLSYVAAGQLFALALFHFVLSFKGRRRRKRKDRLLHADIDSFESSKFEEVTEVLDDGLPEPIPGSSHSLSDSLAEQDTIIEI